MRMQIQKQKKHVFLFPLPFKCFLSLHHKGLENEAAKVDGSEGNDGA